MIWIGVFGILKRRLLDVDGACRSRSAIRRGRCRGRLFCLCVMSRSNWLGEKAVGRLGKMKTLNVRTSEQSVLDGTGAIEVDG